MSINIDGSIANVAVGSNDINKVYVGSDLVWEKKQPVVVIPPPPAITIDPPLNNWLHLQSGSPSSNWPHQTNKGLFKVGNEEIKQFPAGVRNANVGAGYGSSVTPRHRTFDYGEVVVPDASGHDAGNLVITFESRLRDDHNDGARNMEFLLLCDQSVSAFENNPIVNGEIIALPSGSGRYISFGQKTSAQLGRSYVNRVIDNLPIVTNQITSSGIVIANSSNIGDEWRARRDTSPSDSNFQISFSIHISDDWYDKDFTFMYRHNDGNRTSSSGGEYTDSITFRIVSYRQAATNIIQDAVDTGVTVTANNLVVMDPFAQRRLDVMQAASHSSLSVTTTPLEPPIPRILIDETDTFETGVAGSSTPVSGVTAIVEEQIVGTTAEQGRTVVTVPTQTIGSTVPTVAEISAQFAVANPNINLPDILKNVNASIGNITIDL